MPAWLVTVAVNITDCPNVDGFSNDATEVVVVGLFTTCDTVPDVLPVKLPSPLYTAVMACVAALRDEVCSCALKVPPLLARVTGVPSGDAPSMNWTVPVGTPLPVVSETVAVNVTCWLNDEGFSDEINEVDVLPLFTVNVVAVFVAELKLLSPA